MLSRIAPNPTEEDVTDMLQITAVYARIVERRNEGLQGELDEARERLKAVVAERGTPPHARPAQPGPRAQARQAARVEGGERVRPSSSRMADTGVGPTIASEEGDGAGG